MPPVRRALARTWVPIGALATSSAVTLPTPVHVSVLVAKSIRANDIETPRVPSSTRWQSWSKTSSRWELAALTASTARSAAAAASGPWPRPSTTPNRAALPSRSTARPRSPDVYSLGMGRPALAHSIARSCRNSWIACVTRVGNSRRFCTRARSSSLMRPFRRGSHNRFAAATASCTARLMPTPPIGDIACAASPINSRPGRCQRGMRSTATVSSLIWSQSFNSPRRSAKNGMLAATP